MPSPFDEMDAEIQAVVDETFGEGIRIEPMLSGNYSTGPDPSRPVRTTRATISRAPSVVSINYPATNRTSADAAMAPVEVWLDRAAYGALGYTLRKGDNIVFTDETGEPRFSVAAVHNSDHSDIRVPLVSVPKVQPNEPDSPSD